MTDSEFDGLIEIGQVAVTVDDLERAVGFYRDVLGMKFLFSAGGMAFFDCEGVRLMLAVPEEEQPDGGSSILYFRVRDILGATISLEDRGVSFVGQPHRVAEMDDHDLWMSFFHDSEENLMALMSEVEKAAD